MMSFKNRHSIEATRTNAERLLADYIVVDAEQAKALPDVEPLFSRAQVLGPAKHPEPLFSAKTKLRLRRDLKFQ